MHTGDIVIHIDEALGDDRVHVLARLRLRPTRHGVVCAVGAAPVERREAMLPV
jgi:hypothetical protein